MPRCELAGSTPPAPAPRTRPPQIWQRLGFYQNLKAQARAARRPAPGVGVLGCMAERLKQRLLEADKLVDVVAGPDAYRDLPRLIDIVRGDGDGAVGGFGGGGVMNVQLSADETYADIVPVRRRLAFAQMDV